LESPSLLPAPSERQRGVPARGNAPAGSLKFLTWGATGAVDRRRSAAQLRRCTSSTYRGEAAPAGVVFSGLLFLRLLVLHGSSRSVQLAAGTGHKNGDRSKSKSDNPSKKKRTQFFTPPFGGVLEGGPSCAFAPMRRLATRQLELARLLTDAPFSSAAASPLQHERRPRIAFPPRLGPDGSRLSQHARPPPPAAAQPAAPAPPSPPAPPATRPPVPPPAQPSAAAPLLSSMMQDVT
jgi:hypothetical protein